MDRNDVQIHVDEGDSSLSKMSTNRQHQGSTSTVDQTTTSIASTASDDPSTTTMIPFVPTKLFRAAKWVLDVCDDCGERLAYFFGITSPKYEYEINAYHRTVKQEQDRQKRQAESYVGWTPAEILSSEGGSSQPISGQNRSDDHPLPLSASSLETDHRVIAGRV